MKKILIVACITLAILSACLAKSLIDSQAERGRLQDNQESLMSDIEIYRTKSGESAASVLRLQLTCEELERNYKNVCQEAQDLDLKIKRLQSIAQAGTQTEVKIRTVLKDSIIYKVENRYIDTMKCFAWADNWVNLSGVIDSGHVSLDVHSVDTLIQLVHRVPKRFLFFRWGTKAIRQEIVSSNPHTNIVYSDYIELVK